MIKRFKPVIILGCTALALGILLWVLMTFVLPKAEDAEGEGAADTSIALIKEDLTKADSVEIKTAEDSYKLIKKAVKTYYMEGKRELPTNYENVEYLLMQIGELSATKKVLDAPDEAQLKEFGLNPPAATVTVTDQGKTYRLFFGIVSATGSYYLQMEGDQAVYLVGSGIPDMLSMGRYQFYIDYITSYTESMAEQGLITDITIAGKERKETVVITSNDQLSEEEIGTAYILTAPIEHSASSLMIEDIVALLADLANCAIVDDDTGKTTLKQYGLDDPVSTLAVVLNGKKETIYFGKVDGSMQYCYAKGGSFVHAVSTANTGLLTSPLVDFCEDALYTRTSDSLSHIKINGKGKTYNIAIGDKDEEGNMDVVINNRKVESDLFADFYLHLYSITLIGMDENPTKDEPIVTVTYTVKETGEVDVVEFYPINDTRCCCVINGSGRFVVSAMNVDLILENAQHLYDGEKIELEYF